MRLKNAALHQSHPRTRLNCSCCYDNEPSRYASTSFHPYALPAILKDKIATHTSRQIPAYATMDVGGVEYPIVPSCRICDWVSKLNPAPAQQDSAQPDLLAQPKRKLIMSEFDTPRQKRLRQATNPLVTNPQTPAPSVDAPVSEPPTFRPSAASSRSSSPSKKGQHIEAEFSKPAHKQHSRLSTKRWKEQNTRQIPLFDSLQRAIHEDSPQLPSSAEIQLQHDEILEQIEQCKQRSGSEDMWSDAVVYPILRQARRMSKWRERIDVINVKSIDVNPDGLLPQASYYRPKKRIDYTIGLKITDDDDFMQEILNNIDNRTINQSTAKMVRDRALCANIEIKTSDAASEDEAKLQHFTWCAAGFAKQQELWLARERRRGGQQQRQELTRANAEQLAPVPLWLWTRNTVEVFVAVMDSERRVDVLTERGFTLDADDPQSFLRIVNVLVRVMNWGYTEYLPWLKKLIGEEHFGK